MKNSEFKSSQSRSAIATAMLKIFSPLVRLLLRNGIAYKTAAEWLRWSYAVVARDEFKLPDRKQTKSRIAVLTGLSRVDVDNLLNGEHPQNSDAIDHYHRASRVLDGWSHDEIYQNDEGKPADLCFDGSAPSFSSLVEEYSGGVPPRAILDELLRVKSVKKTSAGKVRLIQAYFVASNDEETLYQFGILGYATSSLLETIDHNIYQDPANTRLQLIASNESIPVSLLAEIKDKLQEYGRQCVTDADRFMFEKTHKLESKGDTRRAGISVYYFEDNKRERESLSAD